MFCTMILICLLFLLMYVYLAWNRNYWKNRGVPGPDPKFIWGTFAGSFQQKINQTTEIDELYRQYKHTTPFVGVYSGREPQLLIIDPEMVKSILIKDFKNFEDNQMTTMIDKKTDALLGRNPFFLTGNEWREKRAEITPAFTVSRIRAMYPIVDNVCTRLSEFIRQGPVNADGFEGKELSAKYTTEVVSNCIYGIDSKSFAKERSVLLTMGSSVLDSSSAMMIYFAVVTFFPIVKRYWKKAFVPKKTEDFFIKLTKDSVRMRDAGNNQREDFMNFVLNLRNKKNLSDTDIAAHAITFFIDGFETSSVALCFTMYHLAKNKQIQDKLRNEILKNVGDDGRISFDKFSEMSYLEQVLNEGLRIVPPLGFTTRICKNTIQLTDYKDKKITVEKDTVLLIPYYSIHHDPDIYVNPEKFLPERFDESAGGIKKYRENCTFLSFGDGPRICLGMRFAHLQLKAALAEIVRNFEITLNSKTKEPLVFDPTNILLVNTGGVWLDFKPLKK
ncbi:putative cytochrome P450 28a5 [Pseudolycoriella hygida]|uniref:Cytochrome P450 28a5 n=1 Tax=Pseudolycoriella hygida TaxID=35572 RepID=A0A9Q0S450_9DIPT|nr:putative cytochrome P450 28a5 [Pseudolycoriella hygida]